MSISADLPLGITPPFKKGGLGGFRMSLKDKSH